MQCCVKLLSQHFCGEKAPMSKSELWSLKVWGTAALNHLIISRKETKHKEWVVARVCTVLLSFSFQMFRVASPRTNVLPHWSTVRAARRCRDPLAVVCCSSECRNADISLMTLCTDGRVHQSGRRSQLCVHVKFEACRDRKMIMFHVALGELLDNVRKGQILTLDLTA